MSSDARGIAITGASGMIGRHLCDYFRRRGWRVRALMRRVDRYPFAEPGIECLPMTLPDTFDTEMLRGMDVVVHAAYATRGAETADARRTNIDGTLRVLGASRSVGVHRFIFVSSFAAQPYATSFYGRSKHEIERQLDSARDLIIRPGLVLAPDGGLAQRISRSLAALPVAPLMGGGRQIVQTIHIDDLCAAFEQAIARDLTGTLSVAEPVGVSMRELVIMLGSARGRKPLILPVPRAPFIAALRIMEAIHIPLPVTSENAKGLAVAHHVDTAPDLARLGIRARSARESVDALSKVVR